MKAAKRSVWRSESATHVLCALAFFALSASLLPVWATAAQLEIVVSDPRGGGVSDAVVAVAHPGAATEERSAERAQLIDQIVDQLEMRFIPEVLVVPVGSSVSFPNSDSVSHQVYSFSSAKRFQLPLYKGSTHAPVRFDKPGLVVMGCNIHDQMVGYIYVTDAPWYGRTDATGKLTIPGVSPGDVTVTVWSPRIADARGTLMRTVSIADAALTVEFRLTKNLRATPEPRPRNPNWDY